MWPESARAGASQVAREVENLPASAGDVRDVGSIPELGRSPGGGMATHSDIFAWRIPWTEEPGGLQCIEWQRVRHDWSDSSQNSTARGRETKSLRYSTMDWKTKERPLFTNGELSESSDKKLCLEEKCACYRRCTGRGTTVKHMENHGTMVSQEAVTAPWTEPRVRQYCDWTNTESTGAVVSELSELQKNSERKSSELRNKDNE